MPPVNPRVSRADERARAHDPRRRPMRVSRVRRRPDHWADEHARARARAAERSSEPLSDDETRWLDRHLAACDACRAVAATYDQQRLALRALAAPEPPRDLWARTAARIEQEA